jgi:hypothetical protein
MQSRVRHSVSNKFQGKNLVISGSGYWTQLDISDITLAQIVGGIRITWTPVAGAETEIYVSIDGGSYSLVTTTGLAVGTYDYTCDDGFTYSFKARTKFDATSLNIPSSLAVSQIEGGARVTWVDNNTLADHYELWANINSGGYALLVTLLPGVQTYDHVIGQGNIIAYKVRAKEGTLPVYSSFPTEVSITLAPQTSYANPGGTGNRASLITVTGTIAWTTYGPPAPQHLVNGVTTTDDYNLFDVNSPNTGKTIVFDFKAGNSKVIDEAKWYQTGAQTHGTWKWQGSNDNSAYTDIGGSFTLGGSTVQTMSTLAGNTTGYRYYRLIGLGSNVNTNPYIAEVEFKIVAA